MHDPVQTPPSRRRPILPLSRDLSGQLIARSTPESHTTYTRDALGRVTEIVRSTPQGEPIDRLTFTYDAAGHVLAETLEATIDARPYPGI